MKKTKINLIFLMVAMIISAWNITQHAAHAERIKDLATIQGVRSNQLLGYGLVVGLDGSGDQSPFTVQGLSNMLSQLGLQLPPGVNLQAKNVAAVMMTATLPAFATPGQQIDVTISSLGSAKSLRGGTLLMAPLKGADGQIYAMAQGNVVVSGAGAAQGGSKVQINHLSAGRVPNGATVERAVSSPFNSSSGNNEMIRLELQTTDFSNTQRVADAINAAFGQALATATDGRGIEIAGPATAADRVAFLAKLENIEVEKVIPPARIIINARTGSVVMNQSVSIERCAVAHGSLSVSISSTPVISQPGPLSQGQTVVTEKADIQVKQEGGNLITLESGAKLADVVKALNALGATPQDLVAILQAMKSSGSLRAELEVI